MHIETFLPYPLFTYKMATLYEKYKQFMFNKIIFEDYINVLVSRSNAELDSG